MTRQEAIETIKVALAEVEWEYPIDYTVAFRMAIEALEQPEIIHCRECGYWKPPHIVLNDGRQRLYKDGECDSDPFEMFVSSDVGLNVGGKCWREYNSGYGRDMRVFRDEWNFCSKAIKLREGMTPAENFGLTTEPQELLPD